MPKMFGISLKILILHWNILPTGAALNGRCLYQYLPNGHANVVRYDDLVSNCRWWYTKLTSIIDMYFTLLSLGSMSLSVGPLCMGLINALFSLAGSRHNLTLPFALGTNTKLLHHSAISSTPRGVMMSIFCRCSSSSLNGYCSAYATHLGGAWYSLLSGLSCKENVPLKHPMSLNTSPYVLLISHISSLLFLLSASTIRWWEKVISYFVCIVVAILTVGALFCFKICIHVCTAFLHHMCILFYVCLTPCHLCLFCTLLPPPV